MDVFYYASYFFVLCLCGTIAMASLCVPIGIFLNSYKQVKFSISYYKYPEVFRDPDFLTPELNRRIIKNFNDKSNNVLLTAYKNINNKPSVSNKPSVLKLYSP
jgi:hypothetical protein